MMHELAALLTLATSRPSSLPTPQSLRVVSVRAPLAVLHLQVASTEEQRERGLMSVTRLPPHTGMIFVFDRDQAVAFWMKDTLVPLDMLFLSPDGTVRRVFPNVPVVDRALPDDRIPLEQGEAKYVIELPAGEAAKDGLRAGSRIAPLPQ